MSSIVLACTVGVAASGQAQPIGQDAATDNFIATCYATLASETDYERARQVAFACLDQLEARLRVTPNDQTLLLLLAEACGGLSLAFAEDAMDQYLMSGDPRHQDARAKARALFQQGRAYAERAILLDHPGYREARARPPDDFRRYLDQEMTKADVPALFWYAYNWGAFVGLSRDDPTILREIPGLRALGERLVALDETYLYAGAHVLLGLLDVTLPPLLGGSLERGRTHFLRAQHLNGGVFLLGRVEYAHFYAVQTGDRSLFEHELRAVLEAPADVLPGRHRLLTLAAQRKARRLLHQADRLFATPSSASPSQ